MLSHYSENRTRAHEKSPLKTRSKNTEKTDRTFHFQAYSEARIMNGLLWILLQRIENQTAEALRQFDLTAYFNALGIAQRLSSTRLNGLKHIEETLHHL